MKGVVNLTVESFDEVINGDLPVLVDFWAAWCGPCKMIGPIIEELAADNEGKAIIAKVNVDDAGEVAQRYGITSIPNIKIFKNGVEVENVVGATPKATMQKALDRHI